MRTKTPARPRPNSQFGITDIDRHNRATLDRSLETSVHSDFEKFVSRGVNDPPQTVVIEDGCLYSTHIRHASHVIPENHTYMSSCNMDRGGLPAHVTKFNRHQRLLILRGKRLKSLHTKKLPVDVNPVDVDRIQGCFKQGNNRGSAKSRKRKKGDQHSGHTSTVGRMWLDCISDTSERLFTSPNCSYCGAKKFVHETANFCCSDGNISLAHHSIPPMLKDLVISTTEEATKFRSCIRTYNNHLAFTSFGVKYDRDLARMNKGIYIFRVQGQVYHFIDPLFSKDGECKNLQFYFFDTDYEIESRIEACSRLSEDILSVILYVLQDNPYAKFFRSLRNQPNLDTFKIVLYANPDVDQRVYNRPTVSQVSGLWVEGEENGENNRRHIQVYTHKDECRSIEYYFGCYDPLQYPLLFPCGDLGWHQGIPKLGIKLSKRRTKLKSSGPCMISPHSAVDVDSLLQHEQEAMQQLGEDSDFVSVREYYAYKFQMRELEKSMILHFGRLTQQFFVDMFVKLETQRLDYYRLSQDDYRKEFLQGIVDAVSSGETDANKIGQKVVLPCSFIGGPRHMRRKYIDAMTLVQKYGKPDLFITVTCNPNWPEIKENLLPREHVEDRPDLVSRVFHAKLEELKIDLFKRDVFGEVVAFTYVIEFQKRGLPHAHFLLILKSDFKLYKPEEYDKFVSAEIPDKERYPHLYKLVKKHMFHGPCGNLKPDNVCMKKNGKCKNSFPKEFCSETTQTTDAYPRYKRRDTGEKIKIRGSLLDNRWIVPYNPYLLAKYDCHINVEICSTIKAVKYIYKYICKGNDKIFFSVAQGITDVFVDEIKDYVSARWVSPPEAAWKIYRFSMGELKPPVIHLPLHLENFQPIMFKKKNKLVNVACNVYQRKTMLTEFFFMNRCSEDAQKLNCTYVEFPDYFVWMSESKSWRVRQRGQSIGRIVTAHPSEGERYFLRLLLMKVRCPKSYDDLKTYNGLIANSFREAGLLRGLLHDDNTQDLCLEEASMFRMPYEMRRLFATLLVYSCPNNPRELWLKHEHSMSEDFSQNPNLSHKDIRRMVFKQINDFLVSMGKKIESFNLLPDDLLSSDLEDLTREVRAEKSIIVSESDMLAFHQLNDKQREAFDIIMHRVDEDLKGAFFIDGPGGTGKTFLYRALLGRIRSSGHIALATATSGIAASILPGGRTAHSRFKIPIDLTEDSTCRVSKQSSLGMLIRECKLIIWDEAPMAKRTALEALDDLLRDIMDVDYLFGGKIVVLGGDFRQTLPVVKRGTKKETISCCLINSPIWLGLEKLVLTENMRAHSDPLFTELLLKVGNGVGSDQDTYNLKLPQSIVLENGIDNDGLTELINSVYGHISCDTHSAKVNCNRAILTTKNQFVDEINEIVIDKFPGVEVQYLSYDETVNPNDQGQYEDMLNSLAPNGLPPHKLILKPNAPVILLRNLDPTEGLCNGTRLICKSLRKNVIYAQIAAGDFIGRDVFLHRIPLFPPNDECYPVPYKRVQFPIRLCFGMTINKAQGQTLDFVGIYLKQPVFSHGQLYVALSRAKTSSTVKVFIHPRYFNVADVYTTKNIVYKAVLNATRGVNEDNDDL